MEIQDFQNLYSNSDIFAHFDLLHLGINQILGLFQILLSIFGLYLSNKVRRPSIFRVKMLLVYSFLFVAGFISVVFLPHEFHEFLLDETYFWIVFHNLFFVSFAFHITILYYREMKKYTSREGFFRQKVIDFIDNIPDCIFVQDRDGKYMYVNSAFCSLMGIEKDKIIGKNNFQLKSYLEKQGIQYEFDLSNERSNNIVKEIDKPYIFIDQGHIGKNKYALQVYKSPVYNECFEKGRTFKKYIGTIGITRDMTYDIMDHEQIDEYIQNEDIAEALNLFYQHKTRRDTNPFTKEFLQEIQNDFKNKDVYVSKRKK